MLKAFAETLGADRQEAFVALGIDQVERALGRFGTPQRTITLSRQPSTAGEPRYVMGEDYKLPMESGNATSGPMTFDELKERASTIVRLLPPDFGP